MRWPRRFASGDDVLCGVNEWWVWRLGLVDVGVDGFLSNPRKDSGANYCVAPFGALKETGDMEPTAYAMG